MGVTHCRLRARLSGHKSLARKERGYHLTCWIGSLLDADVEPLMLVIEIGIGDGWGEAERKWIRWFRAARVRLTNATEGGEGCLGHAVSPEARAKMGATHRGKPLSKEHRAKVAAGNRGKKMSPEAVAKTVAAHQGSHHSQKSRERISAAMKGRPRCKPNAETIAKRAATMAAKKAAGWVKRGYPMSAEAKLKLSEARRGHKHSPEARMKMSISKQQRDAEKVQS